jgi:hypothetical protein
VEERIFGTFGKVAGIGGLALGVLLYVFREVLHRVCYFKAASALMKPLISSRNPDQPMPTSSLGLLALLVCLVIGSAVYLLAQAIPETPKTATSKSYKVCMGNGGGNNCLAGSDASFDCNQYNGMGGGGPRTTTELGARFCSTTVNSQKKQQPFDIKVYQNNGGGQCGWTGFLVTCNPAT